jgi:hypothetical protein
MTICLRMVLWKPIHKDCDLPAKTGVKLGLSKIGIVPQATEVRFLWTHGQCDD